MVRSSWIAGMATATALAISTTPAMAADGSGVSGVWAKRYSYWGGSDPYSSGGSSSSGSDSFDDSSSGFPGLSGTSLTNAIHYRTIHGILAVVAIVVLMPVGAVLMRIIPGRFAIWIHAVTQVLAYLLFVAGAALGIYLVQKVQIPFEGGSLLSIPSARVHPIMGIVTLVLLFFQPILGFIHHARFKKLGRRTIWSYLHLWNGRIGISLGIITGGLGLRLAHASRSAKIAYAIVAAIIWFVWFVIAVFSEFRRGRRSRSRSGTAAARVSSRRRPPPSPARRDRRDRRDRHTSSSSNGSPEMTAADAAPLRPSRGDRLHRHRSHKVSDSRSRGSDDGSHSDRRYR